MDLFSKRKPQARDLQTGQDALDRRQVAAGMREKAEKDFDDAKQDLADVQATLRQLKAEYVGLPERIGRETRRFHAALEAYNGARQKIQEVRYEGEVAK
jgi:predicted  nucleic acid-binding Zn-ribbon protein